MDESRFSPTGPDGREHVWRCSGQWHAQCNFVQRSNFFNGSVMDRGGISCNGWTDHFFDYDSMNASMYYRGRSFNCFVPYIPFVVADYLFMHDNTHSHVARWMFKFLVELKIAQIW